MSVTRGINIGRVYLASDEYIILCIIICYDDYHLLLILWAVAGCNRSAPNNNSKRVCKQTSIDTEYYHFQSFTYNINYNVRCTCILWRRQLLLHIPNYVRFGWHHYSINIIIIMCIFVRAEWTMLVVS